SGSFVVRPGRFPASRSAWRTHRRSASTVQPNFSATDRIVAHCDGCSWAWSKTIRTARSRSSGEYLLGRGMGSILSRNEPSDKPGTIQKRETRAFGARYRCCFRLTKLAREELCDRSSDPAEDDGLPSGVSANAVRLGRVDALLPTNCSAGRRSTKTRVMGRSIGGNGRTNHPPRALARTETAK